MSLSEPTPDVIIYGDSNLLKADWKTGSRSSGATVEEQKMVADWMELADEYFLIQQITGATHREGYTLDLFFVNKSDYIYSHQILQTIQSDLFLVESTTSYRTKDAESMEASVEEVAKKKQLLMISLVKILTANALKKIWRTSSETLNFVNLNQTARCRNF